MVRDPPPRLLKLVPGTGEDDIQYLTLNLETMYLNDGSSPLGIQNLINHVVFFVFFLSNIPRLLRIPLPTALFLGLSSLHSSQEPYFFLPQSYL